MERNWTEATLDDLEIWVRPANALRREGITRVLVKAAREAEEEPTAEDIGGQTFSVPVAEWKRIFSGDS